MQPDIIDIPGTLTISIDMEAGWGMWDILSDEYTERCLTMEAEVVERLLALFDIYEVPATWAIVAGLLSAPAAERMPGPRDLWTLPHLVRAVRDAPRQEIGSHTSRHIYYHEVSADSVKADLAEARAIHEAESMGWGSFVFPRNQVNHLEVLAASGVKVFRSLDQGPVLHAQQRFGPSAARVVNLLEKGIPVAPALVRPRVHRDLGMVELPSSVLLMGRNGPRRLIHPEAFAAKLTSGLHAAAKHGGMMHLWFHPSNFYYDCDTQMDILEATLKVAYRLRRRGELAIEPMGAFARLLDTPPPEPSRFTSHHETA